MLKLNDKSPDSLISVVNFSGVNIQNLAYKPGNNGVAMEKTDLKHYNVLLKPGQPVGQITSLAIEPLEGNSQTWLCLQDISSLDFMEPFGGGRTELIMMTDNNWDMKPGTLKCANNSNEFATIESVTSAVLKAYSTVNLLVAVHNDDEKTNPCILKLADNDHHYRLLPNTFAEDATKAVESILKEV